jgi:hypothetical protein
MRRPAGVMVRSGGVAGLALVLLMASGISTGVIAQGEAPLLGTPVPYVGADGSPLGTVTVTEVLEPFTGFREGYGPDTGAKFVVVNVKFEGSEEGGFEASPYNLLTHDTAGNLWQRASVTVPDDYPVPELTTQQVGPGSSISGWVGFIMPDDVQVDDVFYNPDNGILLTVGDLLPNEHPAIGSPVDLASNTEGAAAVGTVKAVEDPYKKFDKDRPPADGARFVMTTLTFENTGTGPFRIEPSGIVLRDQDGNLWGRETVTPAKKAKIPVLESVTLDAGNKVTGRLGYQVPKGAVLEGLYFQGDGHMFQLADLDGAPTPTTEPTATVTCDQMQAWWADVLPLMSRVLVLPWFQSEAPAMDLAASKAALAELESISAAHVAISPPPGLVDAHRQFLGGFRLYEQSARDQVAAQEGNDLAKLSAAGETFEAAQIIMANALAALDPLGFNECVTS